MLLELAIGDAYGAGFEYVNAGIVAKHNDLTCYIQHPRNNIRPGCYTDDTQMTLAIAEFIVGGAGWTPLNLAQKFVDVFKRDEREGYAGRFHQFLCDVKDGEQFLAEIQPNSDKSGAAMRAAPIGIFAKTATVIERSTIQAAVTHNTPDGINAAVATALMTHYFLHRHGTKRELDTYINDHTPGDWRGDWQGKVGAKGWMSVRAAITAVMRNDRLSTLLHDCVAFTGDVDTVATIALAAASCSTEYKQDLPDILKSTLERGRYGHNYLLELDAKLLGMVEHSA